MPKQKGNNVVRGKENKPQDESILPDEGNDMLLTMESFLRDYDIQVKERIRSMEKQIKKARADITRVGKTEKLKLSKEIYTMTIKEYQEKGGGTFDFMEFKELCSPSIADISYNRSTLDDTVTLLQAKDTKGNAAVPTTKAPVTAKRVLRGKREAPESSLLRQSIRNTRSRKADFTTPLHRDNQRFPGRQLVTPMITPKFDLHKPLTSAREPIQGETLVSLAGSPVVKAQPGPSNEESNLVSISLMAQQTVLGGRLFLDEGMSPNTLIQRKQIIEEAVSAINSRLEEINSQISASSKLDES